MRFLNQIFIFPLILIVKFYQIFISPISPKTCRYSPSCSSYMVESLKIWGPIKGLYLGIKRLLSCHPWSKRKNHDPVPNPRK
ncbi:MAG: membrane protein insertion efficiency factor YidD [Crocinitomicaceae bacterium]|nr:membrane protein insertion efficiency factor YidD [Crocinitomicaceae bacterium]